MTGDLPYSLIVQHAETLRLMSAYGQIGDWINEITPPEADRSAEATIARAIAGRLAILRQELEPLIATEAAKEAEREVAELAELLADARDKNAVSLNREIALAGQSLALEPALERTGAQSQRRAA